MDDCATRNIIGNINQLRKNGKFTDAILITKDNSSIPIHRNIIAPVSPYFHNLFDRNDDSSNIIKLNINITGYLLNIIIDFIYTGTIDITYENAKILNKYANKFGIKNLAKSTEDLLIDNLNDETCLEYWRHSVEIENENLNIKCFNYILENPEDFFQYSLYDLTFEEFENIISNDKVKCIQEILYTNIIQWIKKDYNRRHHHLKEFFRSLRLSEFNIPFITSQILNDEILIRNNDIPEEVLQFFKNRIENPTSYIMELSEKALACIDENVKRANFCNLLKKCIDITETSKKTYYEQANKLTEMANNLQTYQEKIINSIPKNERILNFGKIHAYEIDFPNKIVTPISYINRSIFFAASSFRSEYVLLSGGGYCIGSKTCKLYCDSTKTLKLFPSMNENRTNHRSINLNDEQIYACGGNCNKNSVEFYDINSECWIKCLNVMNKKSTNFGLIDHGNSLYAFGGANSSNIEHFDPRIGVWTNLMKNSDITGTTRSVCINDYVYCFGRRFGKIYDIRKNDWIEGIMYPNNGENSWNYLDVVECNNLIYILGYNYTDNESLFAYDYEEKFWTLLDIKIPKFKGLEFNLIKLPQLENTRNSLTTEMGSNSLATQVDCISSRKSKIWNFFKCNLFSSSTVDNTEKISVPKLSNFDPLLIKNEKLIFLSYNWIYNLNFNSNKLDPILKNYHPHMFSTCEFNKNCILLSGGLFQIGANICKYYCDSVEEIRSFPSLIDNRIYHKTITLNDKIYACGGLMNNKFFEIFDQTEEKWTKSSERMIDKVYNFGITTYGGCIYTFGGIKDNGTIPSDTVEQFDPRVGKWIDLKSNSSNVSDVNCLTINNLIYCFETNYLYIFDVRKNHWINKIFYSDILNSFVNFDIAEFGGKILMIGQLQNEENCIKIFNIEDNSLEKINFNVSEILLHNMNLIKIFKN